MGKIIAVVPAAGVGSRMGTKVKKQYLHLQGRPILSHTLDVLEQTPEITGVVLVVAPGEEALVNELILQNGNFTKVLAVVPGGSHRQTSVYQGLLALPEDTELVVIHDGARPLIRTAEICDGIQQARVEGAVALAVPLKDTVKMVDQQGFVIETPPRDKLWAVQTPQIFLYDLIKAAHQKAAEQGILATDDCALVEALSHPVKLIMGSYENIKITTPEDLILAEAFLVNRID